MTADTERETSLGARRCGGSRPARRRWSACGATARRVRMALSSRARRNSSCPLRLRRRRISLGRRRASAAIRLERALVDLYGLKADGAPDARPWLDHGRWPVRAPLGAAAGGRRRPERYAFLAAEGQGLHQIPVGPVHAGVIEPGHFRFHASGETWCGWRSGSAISTRAWSALMRGADVARGAQLAGPDQRRQHGRLPSLSRARSKRRWISSRRRARRICARDGRTRARSPITSATSARSATTPRSR